MGKHFFKTLNFSAVTTLMKNFIIFFTEKEGTSPLVRLLHNFESISIIHQRDNSGWEPFDAHFCGPMTLRDLQRCLDFIFQTPQNLEQANQIYAKTALNALDICKPNSSIGFKMRFTPPNKLTESNDKRFIRRIISQILTIRFKQVMFDLTVRHHLVIFFAVRQDVLRWALSKYHGDGTGRPGHLQFKLAKRKIRKEELGKMFVNCERLSNIISECERTHRERKRLMRAFQKRGVEVFPLRYEDFLQDQTAYFQHLGEKIGLQLSREDVSSALSRGAYFQKVHSDRLEDFVENAQEVIERFGECFVAW